MLHSDKYIYLSVGPLLIRWCCSLALGELSRSPFLGFWAPNSQRSLCKALPGCCGITGEPTRTAEPKPTDWTIGLWTKWTKSCPWSERMNGTTCRLSSARDISKCGGLGNLGIISRRQPDSAWGEHQGRLLHGCRQSASIMLQDNQCCFVYASLFGFGNHWSFSAVSFTCNSPADASFREIITLLH